MKAVSAVAVAAAVAAAGCSGGRRAVPSAATRSAPASTAAGSPMTASTVAQQVATAPSTTTSRPPPAPGCPVTPPRAVPDPDRPRYTLTVDVDAPGHTASGAEEVRFTPDMATDRLVLRLWPNGPLPAGHGGHLATGPVTVDGTVRPSSIADPTTLTVPMAIAARQSVTIDLPWRLDIPVNLSERWSVSGASVRLASFVPLLAWEPGVGWDTEAPTVVHGEATSTPAADWDVRVDAHGLDVLAAGTQDGTGHWTATAARDFALSAGRFTERSTTVNAPDPVAVTVGVAAGVGENPQTYLDKAAKVIVSLAGRFGAYPFPTYTLAVTPGLAGGIEDPMFTMQGPGTIGRSTSHEIGHMWFYALVGNDQARDPWLDEGLATWAEAGYEGTLGSFVSRSIPVEAMDRAARPVSYWDGHISSYYRGVYVQPTQALARLGPPAQVDCVLAAYAAASAWKIARPSDLLHVLAGTFPDAAAVLAGVGIHP